MGMLLRRHRKGVDIPRQVDTVEGEGSLPTPPVVPGDTGVPDTTSTTVPTGEVPAKPVDPPTGDDAIADGTPGGDENVEDKTGTHDGQTVPEVKDEASEAASGAIEAEATASAEEAPKRNASKEAWEAFYAATNREIVEGASRDDLAEAVLGPKG